MQCCMVAATKKAAYFGVLSGLQALSGGCIISIGKAISIKGNNAKFVSSED